MLIKSFAKLGVILALISSAQTFAGYSTLELSRSEIKFPKYSSEEKKQVFNQAKLILSEMFVHQDVKLKDFGQEANPLPKLDILEKKLNSISDTDFHTTLTDIFIGLKDLHTIYYYPKPFSCYESFLPFRFRYVNLGLGRKGFAVTSVHTKSEVVDLLPKPFNIAEGDLLISYNGTPIYDAVTETMPKTYGANAAAQFRLAQDDLRYYSHGIDPLPKDNTVEVELQNAQGQRYKLKLPWITYADDDCINPPSQAPVPELETTTKTMGSIKGETEEPILYWHINSPSFGDFAYIELTSFNPEVLSNDETVIKIRDLLLNELKDTKGLVIDLRENGGGQIPLAEKIVQLFSPREVNPLGYLLKNSRANYVYLTNSDNNDPFTAILKIARELGTPYTTTLPISEKEEINDLGQAYFKPVAVFVNSKCYSSCEVLAAQMQDHEVATIFGEDLQTGGGGANYYTLNKLLEEQWATTNSFPFAKLPLNQEIQFAFRQAVRVGKNAGVLIEDIGVRADRLSQMSRSDIFNSRNDQMLILQRYLSSISDRYTSSIYLAHENRYDIVQNQEPLIQATWTDTTSFEFKNNGKTIEKKEVDLNSSLAFSLPINTKEISDGKLEIYGSNNEVPVWRKIIRYRVIPEFTPAVLNQNLTNQLSIYSVISTKENGWQRNGDELIFGNGKLYENSTESEASLFVTLPAEASTLAYTATIDSEVNFDYFKVFVVSNGEAPLELQKFSGHLPETNYNLDLSTYAGMNIELRFVFKTDEGTKDKGVTLKDVKLQTIPLE